MNRTDIFLDTFFIWLGKGMGFAVGFSFIFGTAALIVRVLS